MFQIFRSSTLLFLLSGMLAVTSLACSNDAATQNPSGNPQSKPLTTPEKAAVKKPSPTPTNQNKTSESVADTYEEAITKASRAISIAKSAQSRDDWKLVSSQWQQVVQLLKAVPASSPNYTKAQAKLKEYQAQIDYALKTSDPKAKPVSIQIKCTLKVSNPLPSGTVFRVPIKRREAGTVVIDVTLTNLNLKKTFEMMLDTGASGTAITPQMAAELNLETIAAAEAGTAAGRAIIGVGCLDGVQVANASINNVPVGIPQGLDIGLLGQDFFGRYDMTIKNNVVEFRVR